MSCMLHVILKQFMKAMLLLAPKVELCSGPGKDLCPMGTADAVDAPRRSLPVHSVCCHSQSGCVEPGSVSAEGMEPPADEIPTQHC